MVEKGLESGSLFAKAIHLSNTRRMEVGIHSRHRWISTATSYVSGNNNLTAGVVNLK